MTVTLPSEIDYGFVMGRWILAIADTPTAADHPPDAKPATGTVTFTRKEPTSIRPDTTQTDGTFVGTIKHPIQTTLDEHGELALKDAGRPGVWLIHGAYTVRAIIDGASWPVFDIVVGEEHTESSPLDLLTWSPIVETPTVRLVVSEELALRAEAAAARAEEARTETFTARDTTVEARDATLTARSETITALSGAEAARDTAVGAASDAELARDEAVGAAGEAEEARLSAWEAVDTPGRQGPPGEVTTAALTSALAGKVTGTDMTVRVDTSVGTRVFLDHPGGSTMLYGDTGWRIIPATSVQVPALTQMLIRRTTHHLHAVVYSNTAVTAGEVEVIAKLPPGFRAGSDPARRAFPFANMNAYAATNPRPPYTAVVFGAEVLLRMEGPTRLHAALTTWAEPDWPTSQPGTPA